MLIQGAFRHVGESVTAGRFLKVLADQAPGGYYFVAQPPPGIIMTAAIDWRVIVPDGAPVDALATALWAAYRSLVMPPQNDDVDHTPLIFIQIKNVRGGYDEFTIGKDVDNEDGLVHRVRESVAVLSCKDKEAAFRQQIEKTAESDYWLSICCS